MGRIRFGGGGPYGYGYGGGGGGGGIRTFRRRLKVYSPAFLEATGKGDLAVTIENGDKAVFRDGRTEAFDIVICATGYRLELPFIDPQHLNPHQGLPRLFLQALHPERDDLAVCGLIQPDSGQWGLTDLQAQLVARMALARQSAPRAAAWLYRQRQRPGDGIPRPRGIEYVDSPRHQFEIEHHSYRRRLEHLIQAIDRRLRRDGAC